MEKSPEPEARGFSNSVVYQILENEKDTKLDPQNQFIRFLGGAQAQLENK